MAKKNKNLLLFEGVIIWTSRNSHIKRHSDLKLENLKSSETQSEITKLKEFNRALIIPGLVKAQYTSRIIIPNLIKSFAKISKVDGWMDGWMLVR